MSESSFFTCEIGGKMTKGRKPVPTAIKQLRGTVQPCRTNPDEIQLEAVSKLPRAPRWFSDTAKKIYKTKGNQLRALGVLTSLDFELFLSFCREYADYIDTAAELEKIPVKAVLDEKNEAVYKRMAKINRESWERAVKLAAEFGFTPSARAKFHRPDSGGDPDDADFN